MPRGEVLRCIIEDDANGEAVIHIDDNELTLREFGRLLTVYAGWGMRIAFVPDDLVAEQPKSKSASLEDAADEVHVYGARA